MYDGGSLDKKLPGGTGLVAERGMGGSLALGLSGSRNLLVELWMSLLVRSR
jgi:hypothetical protein